MDSLVSVESPIEAFNFIKDPANDYSKVAVVENLTNTNFLADTTASIEITNYTGPEIEMKISRSEPGYLVLSEIYYPAGWIATLDGEEIPIHKTNYVLRGMEIPSGDHELKMEFKPSSFYTGVTLGWISLGAQLTIALIFGITYFRNRSSNIEA